jgi:nicotinate phosphoribosyltransferase
MDNLSSGLLTDMYQLTMAYGYWQSSLAQKEAVFHYFFRKSPFQSGYAVSAGLGKLIQFIENYHFDESDISYLASLNYFDGQFLEYLKSLKISLTLDAVPEGTLCFPYEPMIRVQGPLIQCQLVETALLNVMNFSTLIATKAARIKQAAGQDAVLEFGLRRAQGYDGGLTASRSAYIGGADCTSNMLAGKLYGIPVSGTQAHSWIMAHDTEIEAFKQFAKLFPSHCVLLVDTYDTLQGVKEAIEVGKSLRAEGHMLQGIRLDSGDLATLSVQCRKMLDEEGFFSTKIYASNELDEYLIADLKKQGSQIVCWGVGTSLVTGKDQSYLDGVYKLSALREPGKEWSYKLKLSEQLQKISNPGILQVRRYFSQEKALADILYDTQLGLGEFPEFIDPLDLTKIRKIVKPFHFEDLLQSIFLNGQLVYLPPSIDQIRNNTFKNLSQFNKEYKRFLNPHMYPTGLEKKLQQLKLELIEKSRLPKKEL